MKKIIFCFLIFCSTKSFAQTFEGGYMMPGFAKETPFVESDLSGKKIKATDYGPYQTMGYDHILSKNEALTLALILIRDPKDLGLEREIASVIRSTGGYVVIFFSPSKQTWVLNFHRENIIATKEKGLRCFFVE